MKVPFKSYPLDKGAISRIYVLHMQRVLAVANDGVSLIEYVSHIRAAEGGIGGSELFCIYPDEFYCIGKGATEEEAIERALFKEHTAKALLLEGCSARGWQNVEVISPIRKAMEVVPVEKPIDPFLIGLTEGTPVDSSEFPNFYAYKMISLAAVERKEAAK